MSWTAETSIKGPQGAPGEQGLPGEDGNQVLTGAVPPGPATGNDGDLYIDTVTGVIYGPKAGGVWPAGVSIVGPPGPEGDPGPQGIQGIQGVPGPAADTSGLVLKAGDTMTGDLTIAPPAAASLTLRAFDAAGSVNIFGHQGALRRWRVMLASNPAGDFSLARHDDAGVLTDYPLSFNRATGLGSVLADPTAPLGIATKRYVDAYAAPFDAMAYSGIQVNGGFEVSQEAGTAVRTSSGPVADVWRVVHGGTMGYAAQVATSAYFPGYPNWFGNAITVAQPSLGATDYLLVYQPIEYSRVARLQWGTANAKPLTVGFWCRHIRVGTYSVKVQNAGSTRTYVATYTQNVSDTPEWKTITIPGCTDGVWTGTVVGLTLTFVQACGTTYLAPSANVWHAAHYVAAPGQVNGAGATSDIFRIAGVIVLPGIAAPTAAQAPFVMRSFDQELQTCMRYYEKSYNYGASPGANSGMGAVMCEGLFDRAVTNRVAMLGGEFRVRKLFAPTMFIYNGAAASGPGVVGQYNDPLNTRVVSAVAGTGDGRAALYLNLSTAPGDFSYSAHWVADARMS